MVTEEQIKRQAHITRMNHALAVNDPVPDDQTVTVFYPANDLNHRAPFYLTV